MLESLPPAPALPLEEPVFVFAIALAAFLVGPLVLERAGLPGIVGIVLFGTALGPDGLGVLRETEAIVLLGNVGLVYLLFTVGLEIDLRGFAKEPQHAALFGLASFTFPFLVGTAAGYYVLDLSFWAALLLAAVFSSHTLVAYPTVNRLDVTKNRAVAAVFSGILFTDTLALVVLALVLGAEAGGLTPGLILTVLGSLALLFGGIWVVVPPVARRFFRNFSQESYFEFLFVAVVFFAAASLAEALELAAILGAFVAGVVLNRQIPRGGTLMNRIEFLGNAFFIPFFLLYVGMQVDPAVILGGPETIRIAAVIVGVMLASKFGAAWLVARVQGYTPLERNTTFALSVGQAAAALAITLIGLDRGLFGPDVLNAVVLMMLVATVLSPALTQRYGRRLALESTVEPGDGDVGDPRILLPLSRDAERQRRLLELAFVLKDERAESPIHLLTVVQPQADDAETERAVAEVEADLERAAELGGAADVPVEAETRLNHNVASGIVRGGVETRADLLVMGWDSSASFTQRIFGSVIDRVLARTTLPVCVSRLGHPVNTTERIVVVLPHGVDHHEGFYEAVHVVKRLTDRLGAALTVLVVAGPTRQYENLFALVEPDVDESFEAVDDWDDLLPTLEELTTADDLVVAVSPREGGVGWTPELAGLPRALSGLPPASFIAIYPRTGEPEYDAQFLRID